MICGPSVIAYKIFISHNILGYRTGLRNFTTTFYPFLLSMASKTSEYLPLPNGISSSYGSDVLKTIVSYS